MSTVLGKRSSSTITTYLALILYLVLSKFLLGYLQVTYSDPSQAAIFQWSSIATLAVIGLIGVWLADRSGFPSPWDRSISNHQRFVIPAAIGILLGAVSLGVNTILRLPKIDLGFPASLFVYSAGAIVVEVFYRWLPLPLLLWLISTVFLRNKGQEITFWILAVLLSTLEPLARAGALIRMGVAGFPWALNLVEIYLVNLLQAYFFRRYGFLASLTIRLSHYLVWHIIGSILF